jgi:hypothetical protein
MEKLRVHAPSVMLSTKQSLFGSKKTWPVRERPPPRYGVNKKTLPAVGKTVPMHFFRRKHSHAS